MTEYNKILIGIAENHSTYMNVIWPLDNRIEHRLISECGMKNDRNDDTKCVSYCAAFQNLMYLLSKIVKPTKNY